MKLSRKVSLALTAAFLPFSIASALATSVGPYLGAGIGRGYVEIPTNSAFLPPSSRSYMGTAGRAFLGYNFNPYFGLEGGYARYPRAQYVGRAGGGYSSLTYYYRSYDFVAKAYLPINNTGFNLYALGGIARVVGTIRFYNNGAPLSGNLAYPTSVITHAYHNRPIYGLGVNYVFTRHWIANIEWTQIQHLGSLGHSPTNIPTLDLATVNISYNFC
jgi:hypothetical protein